ncbi:hypothetical protein [Arthrobacter sp. TMN-50]
MIATGDGGATNVPGVWAIGNAAHMHLQVLASAADESWTGAMINMNLMEEELQHDLAAYRAIGTDPSQPDSTTTLSESTLSDSAIPDFAKVTTP